MVANKSEMVELPIANRLGSLQAGLNTAENKENLSLATARIFSTDAKFKF